MLLAEDATLYFQGLGEQRLSLRILPFGVVKQR